MSVEKWEMKAVLVLGDKQDKTQDKSQRGMAIGIPGVERMEHCLFKFY